MDPLVKRQKIEATDEFKRKVFLSNSKDHEIPSLEFPPINMPKTLRSLLIIAYSGEIDSSTNRSSDEWSHIMAEDGSLRFDDILPLLPPVQLTEIQLSTYEQMLTEAEKGLSYYNRTRCEGPEYDLVAPLLGNFLFHPEHYAVMHINFLAKPKNTNLPPQLFFAEVVYDNFLKEPDQEPVLRCTLIHPNSCGSSSGATTIGPLGIIHPKDMNCWECTLRDSSSSDDES